MNCQHLLDPDAIYFRDPVTIAPFAIAFAQLMFAHANFESEFRSLQGVITNDSNVASGQPTNGMRGSGLPLWPMLPSFLTTDQADVPLAFIEMKR
jgi:hypothetical protein